MDRKQLRFDDPLAAVLPGFRVADPYVSAHVTLRDALAHRTGTASADLLWYGRPNSNAVALIERLGALPQATSLRERFGYSNLMYMVAGEVLARRSGVDWKDFVAQELLAPLDMKRSSVELAKLAGISNVATPHIRSGAKIVQVPHDDHRNVGPSGAIYSSANDMGRWLRFLLNDGELDGKRLIQRETLLQTMTAQTLIGPTGPADELLFPHSNVIAYGMGWFVSDYRGHRTLSHTGAIDGMAAFISLLPDERLGVAVLSNLEGDMARAVIRNWVFDRYLGVPDTDWRSALFAVERCDSRSPCRADPGASRHAGEGNAAEPAAGPLCRPLHQRPVRRSRGAAGCGGQARLAPGGLALRNACTLALR